MSKTWCGRGIVGLLMAWCLATSAVAEVVEADNETVKQLLATGVTIVDLRTAPEWKETGVVDRSQLLTLFDARGKADPQAWLDQVNAVSGGADQPVVLICRTGNRTRVAARFMVQQQPGRKVYSVAQGITGWMRAGNPVVSQQQNLQHAGISCGPTC